MSAFSLLINGGRIHFKLWVNPGCYPRYTQIVPKWHLAGRVCSHTFCGLQTPIRRGLHVVDAKRQSSGTGPQAPLTKRAQSRACARSTPSQQHTHLRTCTHTPDLDTASKGIPTPRHLPAAYSVGAGPEGLELHQPQTKSQMDEHAEGPPRRNHPRYLCGMLRARAPHLCTHRRCIDDTRIPLTTLSIRAPLRNRVTNTTYAMPDITDKHLVLFTAPPPPRPRPPGTHRRLCGPELD